MDELKEQLEALSAYDDEFVSVQARLALRILDEIEKLREEGPQIDLSSENPRLLFHPEPEITKRYQTIAQILSSIASYIMSKRNLEIKEREVQARIEYLKAKVWQMHESVLQRYVALQIQEELTREKIELKKREMLINENIKRARLEFEQERFEANFEKWMKEYELKKERLEIMKKLKGLGDIEETIKELIEGE